MEMFARSRRKEIFSDGKRSRSKRKKEATKFCRPFFKLWRSRAIF